MPYFHNILYIVVFFSPMLDWSSSNCIISLHPQLLILTTPARNFHIMVADGNAHFLLQTLSSQPLTNCFKQHVELISSLKTKKPGDFTLSSLTSLQDEVMDNLIFLGLIQQHVI